MIIKEVQARSILSVSKVYDYVINSQVGCRHACPYRYVGFMKRFTRHTRGYKAGMEELRKKGKKGDLSEKESKAQREKLLKR